VVNTATQQNRLQARTKVPGGASGTAFTIQQSYISPNSRE
jgi:hypothetical protein